MNVVSPLNYSAAKDETITFTFTRSRPNLSVQVSLDRAEPFQPVGASFSFNMKNAARELRVSVAGVSGDNCVIDIGGVGPNTDRDAIVITNLPMGLKFYTFTVAP